MWTATGVAAATLRPSSPHELLLEGRSVLVIRLEGSIVALEGTCPHQGGLLSDGRLVGRALRCPVHDAAFDVRTGAVLADPFGVDPPEGGVEPLRVYPARVIDGLVEVDLSGGTAA